MVFQYRHAQMDLFRFWQMFFLRLSLLCKLCSYRVRAWAWLCMQSLWAPSLVKAVSDRAWWWEGRRVFLAVKCWATAGKIWQTQTWVCLSPVTSSSPLGYILWEVQCTWGPVPPDLSLRDSYWGHCKQAYIESYGAVFKWFFTAENN